MIFGEQLLTILKNFNTINQSIAFVEGDQLVTADPSKTMIGCYKLTDRNTRTFGLYDISRFLGALGMFKTPNIEFDDDKTVTISSGSQCLRYTLSLPEMCHALGTLDNLAKAGSIDVRPSVSTTIDAATLKNLQRALALLSLPEFAISGRDGQIIVEALDTNNRLSDTWSHSLGATNHEFRVVHKAENLKMLDGDYDVVIGKNGVTEFKNKAIELRYVIMPLKAPSQVEQL